MDKIIKMTRTSLKEGITDPLPDSYGLLVFKREQKALFCMRTNSLGKLREVLFQAVIGRKAKEEKEENESGENMQLGTLEPVLEKFDHLLFIPAADELDTLVAEKRVMMNESPEYQNEIRLYDHYPYLAVNFKESPSLSVKEDTTGKDIYLGPFADRFFLLEVIDLLDGMLNDAEGSILNEISRSLIQKGDAKDKLPETIKRFVITINNELPEKMRNRIEELNNDLEFNAAYELETSLRIIERYYEYLLFFHTIKHINDGFYLNGRNFTIKKGLLESMTEGNKTETFAGVNRYFDDYEEREYLALPKETFREMWTLFKKFSAVYPEKIDGLYKKSILSIDKIMATE